MSVESHEAKNSKLCAALKAIAEHCGTPMPIGIGDKTLMRKWMADYHSLKDIARAALKDGE